MYSLSNLKETVLSYIEKHAQEVFRTESFHELSEEAFGILLASDNLNIDELDLITLVREWATVNSVGLLILTVLLCDITEYVKCCYCYCFCFYLVLLKRRICVLHEIFIFIDWP